VENDVQTGRSPNRKGAEGSKRHQHDLGKDEQWLQLGLFRRSVDPVLEHFGDGPQDGADEWAHQPHIAQQFGFHPRIEPAFEIDGAAIFQAHGGRMDVEIR